VSLVQRLIDLAAAIGADIKRLTAPKSPVFTYTAGVLTGIEYADGSTKTLSYNSGQLTQIDFLRDGVTTRKTFNYAAGTLASITEVTL
jgi:hypothetical protein